MKSSEKEDGWQSFEAALKNAEKVIQQIIDSGVAEGTIVEQIRRFRKGFPHTPLLRPCIPGDGITVIEKNEHSRFIGKYRNAVENGRVTKFVPASGAAASMFKSLLAVHNSTKGEFPDLTGEDKDAAFAKTFIDSLDKFAFHKELKQIMMAEGLDPDSACEEKDFRAILRYVLTPEGLNYGNLPKGLIKFHNYADHSRTPFAEHIAEAVDYAADKMNKIRIHFTVTPEHRQAIEKHVAEEITRYPDYEFEISYSEQRKQTSTIAADLNGEGFRTRDGRLLFRPAGHGALLVNLYELKGDLVFLKIIDNVALDHLKTDTIQFKQILGGLLVELQDEIFRHVRRIKKGTPEQDEFKIMEDFLSSRLSISRPESYDSMPAEQKTQWLLSKLDRPIRVCAMVENSGESDSGPFWVNGPDGIPSMQIVEKSQVDLNDAEQTRIMAGATHFNPVDIICGVRDSEGKPFELLERVDRNTGFIPVKSKDGQKLKAMELPGLWNGSMADWITIFVEVPLSTFSPVKTVNDLLKAEHQPAR